MNAAPTLLACVVAVHLAGCIDARTAAEARVLRELNAARGAIPAEIVGEWEAAGDQDNTRLVLCSDGRGALFTFGPNQCQDFGAPSAARYDPVERLVTIQVFGSATSPPMTLHLTLDADSSMSGLDAWVKGMRFSRTAVVVSQQYQNAFGPRYPIR